mmetsp:Transcript_70932/g.112099  ORF Transcript_70932/g.112099 Transcript_70932/m.112099 type:complete len:164 (-) Transcript_70932:129-620(-)
MVARLAFAFRRGRLFDSYVHQRARDTCRIGMKIAPAVCAGAAASFLYQARAPTQADEQRSDFDIWAAKIGDTGRIPQEKLAKGTAKEYTNSDSKPLIWNTLCGAGKIEDFRIWTCDPDPAADLKDDEVAGKAKLRMLMQLGGHLCGHVQFIHGGFLSAIFDES